MIKDPKASFYKWELMTTIHGCHRIYRDEKSGGYSICDYSGKLPHLTDDGVLWIDQSRPLSHVDNKWGIPLLNYKGNKTSAAGNSDEARWLIENLKMDVQIGGQLFYVSNTRIPMIPRKDGVGDISTGHITMSDSLTLDRGDKCPFQIGNFEYGHVVLTHPADDKKRSAEILAAGMSAAYVRLLNIAHAQGYYYLMIDRDGPQIEGLDSFEW